jgi:hypothetical protein
MSFKLCAVLCGSLWLLTSCSSTPADDADDLGQDEDPSGDPDDGSDEGAADGDDSPGDGDGDGDAPDGSETEPDGGTPEPDAGTPEEPVWACDDCPPPPDSLEDWIRGHGDALSLLDYDGHVAVFVDEGVDRERADWVRQFASDAVQYIKRHYDADCHYGSDRLYVFVHEGTHGGGTISSYFDDFSTFRNAIDSGASSWELSLDNLNIDIMSHELAHIVEGSSNCIHESPGFGVWGDSKWAEIFQYDLYRGLGMEDHAQKLYDRFSGGADPWFPKFYYPLYRDHGGVKVLDGFFKLLSRHFPTRPENDGANQTYARRATLGELVHFYSGAAGADVSGLAVDAFGEGFLEELEEARNTFPDVTY